MVRSGVMVLLQRELGLEVYHLRQIEQLPGKTPVDVARRERLRESLQILSDHIGRRTRWTVDGGLLNRGHPLGADARHVLGGARHRNRVGELCALCLEDLSPTLEDVASYARPNSPTVVEVSERVVRTPTRVRQPTRATWGSGHLPRPPASGGRGPGAHPPPSPPLGEGHGWAW